MLLKLGVDISRLADPMRRGLNAIEAAYQAQGAGEAVITSTYEGSHSPASLHYVHRAVDVRLPPASLRERVLLELRKRLGSAFDVVLETDHIHVEHDPK